MRNVDPHVGIFIWPEAGRTLAYITMDGAVVGSPSRVPTGTLRLECVAGDLVGLTPARAALKLCRHLEVTLRAVVASQVVAAGPGAPDGATGRVVQVPGQLMLPIP